MFILEEELRLHILDVKYALYTGDNSAVLGI